MIKRKVLTGSLDKPSWPNLKAEGTLQRLKRDEKYDVKFVSGKEHWEYSPHTYQEFCKFKPKQIWDIKVRRIGIVSPLQKKQ